MKSNHESWSMADSSLVQCANLEATSCKRPKTQEDDLRRSKYNIKITACIKWRPPEQRPGPGARTVTARRPESVSGADAAPAAEPDHADSVQQRQPGVLAQRRRRPADAAAAASASAGDPSLGLRVSMTRSRGPSSFAGVNLVNGPGVLAGPVIILAVSLA
jgi:hypothetical protein